MKGGLLVIRGSAGYLAGFLMQVGRIVICGDVGDNAGDSMYEGLIHVGGKVASTKTLYHFDRLELEDRHVI